MTPQSDSAPREITTTCCIAGGGPAGMMLGFLLARAGIDVVVLEKHADFLRDFRGDTVHPSTLEVMHELGLLEDFLKLPHENTYRLEGQIADTHLVVADFSHLPTQCKFIAFMPQWDFLNFLSERAKHYPHFHLHMQAEAVELIEESGRVAGIIATTPHGRLQIRSDLVVGADGRHSIVRERAGLPLESFGVPIDVFWMRLSRRAGDPENTLGRFVPGRIMALLNRGDYWQCAFVIQKGSAAQIQARGIEAFRDDVVAVAPFLADRVGELKNWDDVKLLSVMIDRLRQWYRPGLLCIGDCAHAMSPVGGVGINLAVQDAVAAANILGLPLHERTLKLDHLRAVQKRRMFPTRMTQSLQVFIQNRVINSVIDTTKPFTLPWQFKLLRRWPFLARFSGRLIGIGFRPEHVHSPQA